MSNLSIKLRESNPGAFSVLQSMVNYLFIIDFQGKTLLTSQSVLEDTGENKLFFENKYFKDYLIDESCTYNLFDSFLLSREKQEIELELTCKDGSRIPVLVLSTTLLKEFYQKEDLILILCADLRLQKKTQATLIESNKMASLGEMSTSMAHELNNPLTIMEGQLRRLEDYTTDEDISKDETIELINKIQRNLGRAVKIIKSFRSISRKGDNDPFLPVKISDFIDEIKELTQKRLEGNNIDFQILSVDEGITLSCRKSSLLQVFINLINNAVDAIEGCDTKWIKLHVLNKENNIIFTVMDSGKGVSLENQIRLFEPFFTTKDIGKGTGLGLSISKNIVEEHQGSLIYASKMKHSCFIITIPTKME